MYMIQGSEADVHGPVSSGVKGQWMPATARSLLWILRGFRSIHPGEHPLDRLDESPE